MVRVKNRYILVQIRCNNVSDDSAVLLDSKVIQRYLLRGVEKFYGIFGAASMLTLNVMYFNSKTHLCIIQTRHGSHRFITSILPLLTVADKETARYRTLYVGATLQQCQKFIVRYQQRYINKHIGDYRGKAQKQRFIEDVTKTVDM